MLFTDGHAVSLADLSKVDSEAPAVAGAAQPTIELTNVIDDTQMEVGAWLLNLGGQVNSPWDTSGIGSGYLTVPLLNENVVRPRYSLSQVVVTDAEYSSLWSDLKRYLVYTTLFNLYHSAARRNKANDRWADKRDEYQEDLKNKYLPRMKRGSVPIVIAPLARPGALWEPAAGVWGDASVSLVGGGSGIADASYDIAITWVDSTQTVNNESAPSDSLTVAVLSGSQVQISIASLNAPDGTARPSAWARYSVIPMKANYWRVYAGLTGEPLRLQATVPYSTKTYTLDIPGTLGSLAGNGQYPQVYIPIHSDRFVRA